MEHTTIAVDLAKSVFQIAVSHEAVASMKSDVSRAIDSSRTSPSKRGHGPARGLRVGALLGAAAPTVWSLGTAVRTARRAAVRAAQQNGPHRRERAPRSEPK